MSPQPRVGAKQLPSAGNERSKSAPILDLPSQRTAG